MVIAVVVPESEHPDLHEPNPLDRLCPKGASASKISRSMPRGIKEAGLGGLASSAVITGATGALDISAIYDAKLDDHELMRLVGT